MKGNKILGFIWIVLAVILTIILIWKLSSTNGKNNFKLSINGKEHIVSGALSPLCETLTFSTNDFNALDVNLASESITVEKAEGNKVIVEFYCPEDVKPTAEIISNTLKIQSSKKKVNFITVSRKVVIKLPASIDLSDCDLYTASGSINISNLSFPQIDINSASGSIHADNCTFDKVDAVSHSGSTFLNNCSVEQLEVKNTSGSIHISGSYNSMELHCVSGSVHVNLDKPLSGNSDIQTTSGSIRINVPEESAMTVKYNVTSGSYRNSITNTSGKRGTDNVNGGGITLELQTTSGSISVN